MAAVDLLEVASDLYNVAKTLSDSEDIRKCLEEKDPNVLKQLDNAVETYEQKILREAAVFQVNNQSGAQPGPGKE